VSLGGTGQRGSLVVALIIFIVGINLSFKPNFTKKINVFLITFGLLAFILLSVFLQREVSSLSEVNIYSSLLSVYNRIFNSNQDSSVIAFRLIYSFDKSYGYDWYMTLLQILPGKLEYLPISNRVFEIMYGSTRGTGTISMLGSTYYNFGTMGIITINFIVGFTLQYLFIRLIRRDKSVFRVLYYSVLFVTLGMWVSEGPSYLVNAGFVTAIIFAFLSKFFYKRRYNYENIDINGSIQ
jgi:oligosaccharide repeat unit polymerase